MTLCEQWAENCVTSGVQLFQLEERGNIRFFETRTPYMCHWNTYYTSPIYHLWVGDEWTTTEIYQEGLNKFWKAVRKAGYSEQ